MAYTEKGKTRDVVPVTGYAALQAETGELMETIRANLEGSQVTEFDLDRIGIPAGGGLAWEVPTLDGIETRTELEGVISFFKHVRAYWPEVFEGGNEPPQCSSHDAIVGLGDPGGECAACPYAQWGSAEDGTGQACKAMMQLFLLVPDAQLPLVITLPPTSLKPARQYLLRLTSHGVRYFALVTRLTLEKAQSKGGITYSRVVLGAGSRLTDEQAARVKAYAEALEPAFRRERVFEPEHNGQVPEHGRTSDPDAGR